MSSRRSSREIAASISACRSGSNQTRLIPHLRTAAAIRFWLARSLIFIHLFFFFDLSRLWSRAGQIFCVQYFEPKFQGSRLDLSTLPVAHRSADPDGLEVRVQPGKVCR